MNSWTCEKCKVDKGLDTEKYNLWGGGYRTRLCRKCVNAYHAAAEQTRHAKDLSDIEARLAVMANQTVSDGKDRTSETIELLDRQRQVLSAAVRWSVEWLSIPVAQDSTTTA